MIDTTHRLFYNLLRHLIATIFIFLLFNQAFGQEPLPEYRFIVLKGLGKEKITPNDTSYKIEIIRTESNKTQRLYFFDYNSADPYWMIANDQKIQALDDFTDYMRIKVSHGTEVMTTLLRYNANIWTSTIIDGTIIDVYQTPGSLTNKIRMDTMIFIPGHFCFKSRKNFNYWKAAATLSHTKKFRMKKYSYSSGGKDECNNDTSLLYVHPVNEKEWKCLLVNRNGVITARGKKRWTAQGRGQHDFQPYGYWVFYNNEGKRISRREVMGKHLK